ncbi:L,D-transpeptidase family protein [Blastomonas marina]|uniref:L,D-transpeptidase family protein n=1 Tax=Blastomonas marina TaxID=1867408 RepID=UPI002AC9C42A|nr:L,D-transpeptidase family protein [Blastomonas marina]WPZ03084.1 L,D-transpeptidase family protein [Blastomonas marina]
MATLSPLQRLGAFGGLVLALGISAGGALLVGAGEDATGQDIAYEDTLGEEKVATPVVQEVQATPEPVAPDPFVIKRVLPISGPIKYGEWHWDDEGVPDGPLVITVDKQARVISVFRDGYEIGAAAVLLGTDEHPTPVGVFPILQKNKDHVSNLYDAEMPYMMRLTWDGVAIHGSLVENGYASHGCVGTPEEFAAKLFAIAKLGDKVVVTDGKRIGVGDPLI